MSRNNQLVLLASTVVAVGAFSYWLINLEERTTSSYETPHPSTNDSLSPSNPSSSFSPPLGLLSLPETAREFRILTSEEATTLTEMMRAFWSTHDVEHQMDLLDQMEERFYGRELAVFVEKLFKSHPPVREEILERSLGLLAGNTSTSVLPALEAAMAHPNESIRESAVLSAGQIRHTAMIAFLSAATNNESSNVRASAFETLGNQTDTVRNEVLSRALKSRFEDTAINALGELELAATHVEVPRLIEALQSPWDEVRNEARLTFEVWFGETFEGANEATTWWEANHERFDHNLVEK